MVLETIAVSLVCVALQASPPPDTIDKETFGAGGKTRAYYNIR